MPTIHLPKPAGLCSSQSPLFPSIVERGSQRPAAVKGAPLFRRGAAYLDGEDRCERIATGRKGASLRFYRPTIKPEFPKVLPNPLKERPRQRSRRLLRQRRRFIRRVPAEPTPKLNSACFEYACSRFTPLSLLEKNINSETKEKSQWVFLD